MEAREAARRTDELMNIVGIGHLANRYPAQLSGGQQQRVSLARAVVVEPSLLLLDEPLSNLDAALRRDVRTNIRSLQQTLNQTAVFVTHDQEEALSISDIIAVLNQGQVEQIGTPNELWSSPNTAFVAKFMGVENIFDANIMRRMSGSEAIMKIENGSGQPLDNRFVGIRPAAIRLRELRNNYSSTVDAVLVAIDGVISSQVYLGRAVEYTCRAKEDSEQIIKVESTIGSIPIFNVGDEVTLEIDVSAINNLVDDRSKLLGTG